MRRPIASRPTGRHLVGLRDAADVAGVAAARAQAAGLSFRLDSDDHSGSLTIWPHI